MFDVFGYIVIRACCFLFFPHFTFCQVIFGIQKATNFTHALCIPAISSFLCFCYSPFCSQQDLQTLPFFLFQILTSLLFHITVLTKLTKAMLNNNPTFNLTHAFLLSYIVDNQFNIYVYFTHLKTASLFPLLKNKK